MRWAFAVAAALVALLVLSGLPSCLSGSFRAGPPVQNAGVRVEAAAPIGNYTPISNISSDQAGPGGSALPGDRVGYRFQVAVPTYNTSWGTIEVWFPPTVVNFDTLQGGLSVGTGARNLTLQSAGYVGSNLTGTLETMTNLTAFRAQSSATFSTQQQAPMALTPPGTFRLAIEWQWVIVVADGSVSNSSWNPVPAVQVNPGQYADLISLEPRAVAPGGTVTGCLTGPISDRTFALRAVTITPPEDFAGGAGTAPSAGSAQYCLSLTIPSSTPYESVFIRLWDIVSPVSGYLLYAVHIHVTNVTSAPAPLAWTTVVDVGLLGVGALLLLACVVLWRGRRISEPTSARSARRPRGEPSSGRAPRAASVPVVAPDPEDDSLE